MLPSICLVNTIELLLLLCVHCIFCLAHIDAGTIERANRMCIEDKYGHLKNRIEYSANERIIIKEHTHNGKSQGNRDFA